MRLLFVTPYVPLATKPRPFHFIQHLAKSHEIHLVAVTQGELDREPGSISTQWRGVDEGGYLRLERGTIM